MRAKCYRRDATPITGPNATLEWAEEFERADRQICRDELPGNVRVSTVFLGVDHNYGETGPPLIFETMIFGGEHDDYQERYATEVEARVGHARALALAKGEATP